MAKVLKQNLLRNKFCVKNWYHKLYLVYHVRFNSISKYRAIFCNFAIFFYFAEMPIWVPSGASTKHFLVSKSLSGQYATFDTQQCFVLAPEGTQITDFLLPIRDFFSILRFFHFAEMAISVPSGTITEHCLVPKSSSGQGATFGTKQCSVIVPEGTQITDFLLPVREFLEFCDFFYFAEMAIWVPSGTITEHCLVPKSSSGQCATFGTKQCSVIVPEGVQNSIFPHLVRDFY